MFFRIKYRLMRWDFLILFLLLSVVPLFSQAGRRNHDFSEASFRLRVEQSAAANADNPTDDDEIRIDTDLVLFPVRISQRGDTPAGNLTKSDFRIYENGREQEISYFAGLDEPFTVAILIDISYSTVFKIEELKAAASAFVEQLSPNDRVAIIAFDQLPYLLTKPTTNRAATRLAIDSIRTGSGTSLYDALDLAFRQIADYRGRKAVVLLSDGVDTTSQLTNPRRIREAIIEEDVIIYSIRYDTFRDVERLRKRDAEIVYDDNDRPMIVYKPPQAGERDKDYRSAREFLENASVVTGGRVFEARRVRDLRRIFSEIANELRKTYVLAYYPSEGREMIRDYTLRIRVLKPDLQIESNRRLRSR